MDGISKGVESFEKTLDGLGLVSVVEEAGAQVVVFGAIAQHVVRGCEQGGCDGEDGLLAPSTGLDAQELGVQVAGLDAHRCPCGCDEGRLEPVAAEATTLPSAIRTIGW